MMTVGTGYRQAEEIGDEGFRARCAPTAVTSRGGTKAQRDSRLRAGDVEQHHHSIVNLI